MRRCLVAVLSAAVASAGFLILAPPATAADPACDATTCTVTFSSTGASQDFTVPAGVHSLTATVAGGQGGSLTLGGNVEYPGGAGGSTTADLDVTPGSVLTLVVGDRAGDSDLFEDHPAGTAGGFGGGGSGGSAPVGVGGTGGGGGSFLFASDGSLLLAAGGGGGTSSGQPRAGIGGGAGAAAGDGAAGTQGAGAGTAGTFAENGSGGVAGADEFGGATAGGDGTGSANGPGTLPQGGRGGNGLDSGGGGGGGYHAGGGGGGHSVAGNEFAASGGGGAGYANVSATSVSGQAGVQQGPGSIVLTYPRPAEASLVLTSSDTSTTAHTPVTFTAAVTSAGGSPTGTVGFTSDGTTVAGCDLVPLTSGSASCTTSGLGVGTHSIVATYSGDTEFDSVSASLTQAVAAAVVAGKGTPTVRPYVIPRPVKRHHPFRVNVVLAAPGGYTAGYVSVFERGKRLRRVEVAGGRAKVVLGGYRHRGWHHVRVTFSGNAKTNARSVSTTFWVAR